MLEDRMTFRLAASDARNVATIASHMQTDRRTPFVSRTQVLRAALRSLAETLAADAHKATTDAR